MGKKRICGILGNPLSMSLSSYMHNRAFSHLDLDFEYRVFEVEEYELESTLYSLKKSNFRGLNVTHPYKVAIMEFLDEVHESAHMVGAVNTIVNENGSLIGYNTDSIGAMKALGDHNMPPRDSQKKVLILGAGGAARAVSIPLARKGCDIVIANRTLKHAQDLVRILRTYGDAKVILPEDAGLVIEEINLLINSTCVGMKGGPAGSPLSEGLISEDMTVFDLVYNPKKTPLLEAACAKGAKVIYGYEMLIYQGAAAFELWTGVSAPYDLMKEAVLEQLAPDEPEE